VRVEVAELEKIRIGVSACLLGQPVRYDGQHKHDHYITDTLGQFFEFVGVCPEVECGLGVPRESMRLVGDPTAPRLLTTRTAIDHTDRMNTWAAHRVEELEKERLYGFIFKSRSPSSGMENVKVYSDKGMVSGKSPGLFGKAFLEHFPTLPCEDEGRLNDPDLRENFIERVFTLWRYREAVRTDPGLSTLMEFQARNKLLIQSHHESLMREMGRELAALKPAQARAHIPVYEAKLMRALKTLATVSKHTNILQHMLGYLRKLADEADRKELADIIGQYHKGLVPLIVPVTMLRHYVLKHDIGYLKDQYYLAPHPMELKLRNHA
jgi:uncharacterized protein YbgA (DUF1722 family)/uncharacterized protein YbbK (DUF523 family)